MCGGVSAGAIGPGKADVLQRIAETGSLAKAGRSLGMSYQRVWSLVAAMNEDFVEPLVLKQRGGAAGGGAQLTPTGEQVLKIYRLIESDAQRAVSKRLPLLVSLIRPEAGRAGSHSWNKAEAAAWLKVAYPGGKTNRLATPAWQD